MVTTLLFAWLGAVAPAGGETHASVGVDLFGGYATYGTNAVGVQKAGSFGLGGFASVYLRPFIDDDAPLSLQPFLQRASFLQVSASGSGSWFQEQIPQSGRGIGAALTADGYVTRWLALTGSLSALESAVGIVLAPAPPLVPSSSTIFTFDVGAGIGIRVGDLRIDVGYRLTPRWMDGQKQNLQWGQVHVSGQWVIARRASLGLSLAAFDGGESIAFGGTWFPIRMLDFSLGGSYGHANGLVGFNDGGGSVGISWWLTPRFRASLGYSLFVFSFSSTTNLTHNITAGLVARIP